MPAEMLPLEWPGSAPGPVRKALDQTIDELVTGHRLSRAHTASVAIAYTLADIMDAPGRATPRVLAAQQLVQLMERLEEMPPPVEADSGEFDVVLLPVVNGPDDDDEG